MRASAPFVAALGLMGCASAQPVLTPARVLQSGAVALELGGAYLAPVADPSLAAARDAQSAVAARDGVAVDDERHALEAAVALWAPSPLGAASYGALRVGLPQRVEVQAAVLGGRTLRLGARRVVWGGDGPWALTIGGALRGAAFAAPWNFGLEGLRVEAARALGADASVVFGRTSSGLYDPYLALRGGYTHGFARAALPSVRSGAGFDVHSHLGEFAFTVGMRVGFGRVSAMAECGVTAGYVYAGTDERAVAGVSVQVMPAAALSLGF